MGTSTTKRRKPDANELGTQDATVAANLMLWARSNNFAIHGITVGKVTITCSDMTPPAAPANRARANPVKPPPSNIYEDLGGEAWEKAVAAAEAEDVDEDDDDLPER